MKFNSNFNEQTTSQSRALRALSSDECQQVTGGNRPPEGFETRMGPQTINEELFGAYNFLAKVS